MIALYLCAIFYGVLCIFSIVTGLIYVSGKRKLNPLELSDSFVERLNDAQRLEKFTRKMGWVTFFVGIAQGLSSYALALGKGMLGYLFAFGFTIFSLCSVLFKLKGKINAFPLMKLVFYVAIIVILIVTRNRFI